MPRMAKDARLFLTGLAQESISEAQVIGVAEPRAMAKRLISVHSYKLRTLTNKLIEDAITAIIRKLLRKKNVSSQMELPGLAGISIGTWFHARLADGPVYLHITNSRATIA